MRRRSQRGSEEPAGSWGGSRRLAGREARGGGGGPGEGGGRQVGGTRASRMGRAQPVFGRGCQFEGIRLFR